MISITLQVISAFSLTLFYMFWRRYKKMRVKMDLYSHLHQCLLEKLTYEFKITQTYDQHTHLLNRTYFLQYLKTLLAESETDLALFILSVDDFTSINEAFGTTTADTLIEAIAERLEKYFSHHNAYVSRFIGDTFAVIWPYAPPKPELQVIAQEFLQEMRKPFDISDPHIHITVSIGISLFPEDGTNLDALLRSAFTALKEAKTTLGKNIFSFYNAHLGDITGRQGLLSSYLQTALVNHELTIRYQPQICLHSGCLNAVEALLRWDHPELGSISPSDFIPVAEKSGLIISINTWMIRQACLDIYSLHERGFKTLGIALNISAQQIMRGNFVATLTEIIANIPIAPMLEFELTETMLMQDIKKYLPTMALLREMDIQIALDDFGTGYSSLSYLKALPVTTLKIDKSFIHDLADTQTSQVIVQSILKIADSLNLRVIAEGVETAAQLDFLQHQGCDIVQGYYFSHPVSLQRIEDYLVGSHPLLHPVPLCS